MNTLTRYSLYLLGALLCGSAHANIDPYADARDRFVDARNAFQQGHTERYQQLAATLKDYPLYPYLRYDELRTNLARASDADIRAFLDGNPDSVLADRLRHSWLAHLAKQHQWDRFLSFYPADNTSAELTCYYLHATRSTPPEAAWLDKAVELWKVGRSQPNACDPVFKILVDSPRMTEALIWERIRLSMDSGSLSLASYLSRMLPAEQRQWVDLWRQVHHRPSEAQDHPKLQKDTAQTREILAHAVQRHARSDAEAAHQWWESLLTRYRFSDQQQAQVTRELGLRAAYQRLPQAHVWLAAVPAASRDESTRNWQARSALLQQDWPALLAAVDSMPAEEQSESEWRYWKAFAQAKTGNRLEALPELSELAGERSYHGFLAADYLNWNYSLSHQSIEVKETDLERLQQEQPFIIRARELRLANLSYEARREWGYGTQRLDARDLELAAVLAHRWNWHDRAIITAARSGHQDDLDVRFPVLYEREVNQMSSKLNLDPAWIMGVMRQESAFMEDARSPVGALGLMQLMPATGSQVAKLLKLPRPSRTSLLQADTNIQLGSNYLRHVLDELGNQVLATAAYNAGPHRVRRWLPEGDAVPAAIWVDTIPFSETRGYVRGVLAFTTVYDARLQRPFTPLEKRMPPISPKIN